MQSQNNFKMFVAGQNKKNERPRVIREYRTLKEYYPWRVLLIPSTFWVISFLLFIKAVADFSRQFSFGGVFYLILALVFAGIGIVFGYPSKSDFDSCKRLQETIKTAQNKGRYYKGEIRGYKMMIENVIPGQWGAAPAVGLSYVLEVEFLEDTKYKTIETSAMKYNPNAVLKGTQCKVYFYDGKYYVGDYELRTGLSDETAGIPENGMVGDKE